MPQAVQLSSLSRVSALAVALALGLSAPAFAQTRRGRIAAAGASARADRSRADEEADDQADPEGARHQGRRRVRTEDEARPEDLPAPQRPEGHRQGRHGHAALARPDRPAAELHAARLHADPGRGQGRPRPARPVRVRREHRRRVAQRPVLRQVPVLPAHVGVHGRHRQPRGGRRGHAGPARLQALPAARHRAVAVLLRAARSRRGPRAAHQPQADRPAGRVELHDAAFLGDLDLRHPVGERAARGPSARESPRPRRGRARLQRGRSSCPRHVARAARGSCARCPRRSPSQRLGRLTHPAPASRARPRPRSWTSRPS